MNKNEYYNQRKEAEPDFHVILIFIKKICYKLNRKPNSSYNLLINCN